MDDRKVMIVWLDGENTSLYAIPEDILGHAYDECHGHIVNCHVGVGDIPDEIADRITYLAVLLGEESWGGEIPTFHAYKAAMAASREGKKDRQVKKVAAAKPPFANYKLDNPNTATCRVIVTGWYI